MSRDIKFRAIFKPDKETKDGYLIFYQVKEADRLFFAYKSGIITEEIIYDYEVPFLDDDWELMQYTGLKDKNGKECYEGDIAKYYMDSRWKYGQVKMGRGGYEFHVYKMGEEAINRIFKFQSFIPVPHYDFMDNTMQDEFEIIGNIYENPELLS